MTTDNGHVILSSLPVGERAAGVEPARERDPDPFADRQ